MRKNILLLAAILASAACQSHRDSHGSSPLDSNRKKTRGNQPYLIRFKPSVGSTYHYEMTSEITLTVRGGNRDEDMSTKSEMAVNYGISRDSDELVLEMNYEKIHIYEREGDSVADIVATGAPGASDPKSRLLAELKAATIFARVHPADFTVAFSGGLEVIDRFVERNYAESDKVQARRDWENWVDQEIVWKNLGPIFRCFPDSAQYVGDRWTGHSTNVELIGLILENNFQLESIDAGIATIRFEGRIRNDSAGNWLMDDKITGDLSGKEEGVSLVDSATGMPTSVEISLKVEGKVKINGREVRIKYGKMTKMEGTKVN